MRYIPQFIIFYFILISTVHLAWGQEEPEVTSVGDFYILYAEMFSKMANEDDAYAQYMMGISHQHGSGVEKDLVKAYGWFTISLNNGYAEAKVARDELRKELKEGQILMAEAAAKEWFPPTPLSEEDKLRKRLEEIGITVMSTFGHDEQQAIKDLDEATSIAKKLGDANGLAMIHTAKAHMQELFYYNYEKALEEQDVVRQLHNDNENYYSAALTLVRMSELARKIDDVKRAERYYASALQLFEDAGRGEVGEEIIEMSKNNVSTLLEKVSTIMISNNSLKADKLIQSDEDLKRNVYAKELVGLAIQLYRKDNNLTGEANAYALLAKYDQGYYVNFFNNQSKKLLQKANSN